MPHRDRAQVPQELHSRDSSNLQRHVDLTSFVIKSVGSPVHCNDVAPPGTSWEGNGTAASWN